MLETDAGYTIMAADITSAMKYHPMAGFSVSLSGDNAGALRGYWEKLSTSGTTTMPMQKQIRGRRVRHVRRQVRRLVAGRHQPAAGLAAHPGARPPHLARRRRGSAGSAGDRHNAGQTPTSGDCAVLPHLRARATGRAPRFAARPRTAICAPRLSHGRKTTEDGSKEHRSALRAAVYRGDEPAVVLQLAGDGRSLPGSATREGNRCVARGPGVRGGTAVIGVPAGESACAEPEAEAG